METTAARTFVHTLLRAGITLHELLADLVEQCEAADAFPGEEAGSVVIEMASGSVATRLRRVPPTDFDRASELMQMAVDAVLDDLRTAVEIAARRKSGYRVSAE